MPLQRIPNLDIDYWLILFDSSGHERTDDQPGVTSQAVLEQVQQLHPTDVFLFNHGWKGDVPSAIDQYDRWIGAMWRLTADRDAMGPAFRPMFIGLHWPSQPWGEEAITGNQTVSFGIENAPDVGALVEHAVEHFGGGDAVRRPLEVIFESFAADPAARMLSPKVISAYQALASAIGFSAGSDASAAPDEEGAQLDPQAAVKAERMANAGQSFGIGNAIKNGVLAGLRQTSFWLMKHRARTVGEQGMHQFVAQLQEASTARIHLMGHSFGCIVVSSILGGPNANSQLSRPIDSVLLVQGALSLWSYADRIPDVGTAGYFQRVLVNGAVAGPIVTTQSTNDAAVGLAYPAAVGLVNEVNFGVELPKFGGVGTWGIQGTNIADPRPMLDEHAEYNFQRGRIYNLDASRFIPSHSGIDGPQVAHVMWQAAQLSRSAGPA